MLQLLIVDDEVHAVRGIRAGVQWEELGFSGIHEAYNIRQAKEIFSAHKIDILICDIEMPEGDGFQLLAWVNEHSPETESLFLTCHADFKYAQQAIQLGSLDYMLKPVRFTELERTVRKAIGKVQKEKEKQQFAETYKRYYHLWEMHHPIFIERFWQDLLHRSIPSRKDHIQELLAKQKIPYDDTMRFLMVMISVQRWHKELTLREEKIMEYALRNSLEELSTVKRNDGLLVQVKSGALLAILNVRDFKSATGYDELAGDLRAYIDACNRYFFCDLCCYVGMPTPLEDMLSMYESVTVMETQNVTRSNEVLLMSKLRRGSDRIPLPTMDGWAKLLRLGCKRELREEVTRYLDGIKKVEGLDAKLLRGFYEDFLQMIHHVLQDKGLRAHQVFSEMLLSKQAQGITRSVDDLALWVNTLIDVVVGHLHAAQESQPVALKVKGYIAAHLNEDLSREDIAGYVNLNPDYLTRIFKKETGLTISEYVLQERINSAKEMLVKTDRPITDIAYEVGYNNYSYFSKMFKKATGYNPQDYRKSNQLVL
ncbi:helix-turn-helix domain-containing protein [Paenibacillus aurantiacus]|uniref:Helix-turn-helix domain-containing protein n=1 Tax=Paenibacillus aurantiacus TaxID=1936118 RepID=A0ABV5L082_9BACL